MWHDLVYSVRVLSKNLRFAILAVATLGLGIGAATAVFAVFDAALVRALPVRQPERLVVFEKIAADGDSDDSFPYPVFRDLRDRGGAIASPSPTGTRARAWTRGDSPSGSRSSWSAATISRCSACRPRVAVC